MSTNRYLLATEDKARIVYVDPDRVWWGFKHLVRATQEDARRLGCSVIVRVKEKQHEAYDDVMAALDDALNACAHSV